MNSSQSNVQKLIEILAGDVIAGTDKEPCLVQNAEFFLCSSCASCKL